MYAEGHEVGVHLHPQQYGKRRSVTSAAELDLSQLAIAAATGHTTSLLRLPYSAKVADVTFSEWQAMGRAGNYRVVYADLDTQDWKRPGVDAIVRAGTAARRQGRGRHACTTVAATGRRQVAAVDLLITELQQRGYTFDTVTSAVGLSSPWHSATAQQRLRGQLVTGIVRVSD